MPTMTSKSVRTVAAAATAALALLAPAVALPPAAYAAAPSCRDADVSPTVEESRLTVTLGLNPQPVPGQILQRSGYDVIADQFEHSLCATRSAAAASVLVDGVGLRLWKAAVDRARHATSGSLDLPRDDDRPLYWARLRMALAPDAAARCSASATTTTSGAAEARWPQSPSPAWRPAPSSSVARCPSTRCWPRTAGRSQ